MIISSATTQTQTIARVWSSGNRLLCSFREHNDTFRKVVKSHSLEWDEKQRAWARSLIAETSGAPEDRVAELTAALITAGFSCEVRDQIAERVMAGTWEPEQKRWVHYNGKYVLVWRDDENLYRRALMLPEAHYDRNMKGIAVPEMYYGEVVGFAEEHDFSFTQCAQSSIEGARRTYQKMILPQPPAPKPQKRKRGPRSCSIEKFHDLPYCQVITTTALLPHQIPAVEKMVPVRVGALFMDMGTGKTRCAIELVARRRQRTSRVIWFCPVGLKLTIAAEIEKHTVGEKLYIFDGETESMDIPSAFWYVVGIESMSSSDRVVLAVHALIDADTFVIVDESSYIKGHASKRSMRIAELSRSARYRLLLTGTPITQGIVDLYAQMRFLSSDILGYNSFYSFANRHLEYSEKYPGLILRTNNMGELTEKIAPFIYQVTKDECLDLPEKLYDRVYFGLTREQSEAYEQAKDEILTGILEEAPDYIIFQLFTALQQIVSGFWNRKGEEWLTFPHRRVDTLLEVIGGIPEGEKVVIWCKFVESVKQIAAAIPGCALYYGDLNEKQRAAQLERFRGSARFLVATQATGGHGLTLNEACYHVFYENEFKYAHRVQAEDRSHRIGQTRPVTYIDIVSNSGIDQRIQRAIEKKADVVKTFRREVKERGRAEV